MQNAEKDNRYRLKERIPLVVLHYLTGAFAANAYMLIRFDKRFWIPAILCFILAFILPVFCAGGFPGKLLKGSYYGMKMLLMFLVSTVISAIVFTVTMVYIGKEGFFSWWPALVIPYTAELIYFWVGIIVVYINSKQLVLKYRLIGIFCGMIPRSD